MKKAEYEIPQERPKAIQGM